MPKLPLLLAVLVVVLAPACADDSLSARSSTMPCRPGVFEVWRVETRGPGEVFVEVDVRGADPFEPTVSVVELARRPRSANEVVGSASLVRTTWSPDGGFPCADGNVQCPRGAVDLREEAFAVVVGIAGACTGPDAEYALTVGVDGQTADLVSVGVISVD